MDALVPRRFHFEGFTLDAKNRFLSDSDGEIELRAKSFDVLTYLVLHHGELVSKDELIHAVWQNAATTDESLARCVSDIRAVLRDADRRMIKTVPGRGYVFVATVNEALQGGDALSVGDAPRWPPRRGLVATAFATGILMIALVAWSFQGLLDSSDGPALPDRPSIAVLPFANDGKSSNDYLSRGMARSITAQLSRFGDLFVVSSNSTSRFGSTKINPSAVGRSLGVRYLLMGSLQRDKGQIRLSVELIVAENGRQIWSQNYRRSASKFAAIEDKVVKEVVGNLVAHMTQSEYARLARKSPPSWNAYESYLRGNAMMRQAPKDRSGAVVASARAAYTKALAISPEYAPALEGMALTYWTAWLKPLKASGLAKEFRNPSTLILAESLARRSVDADPTRASAWAALGWIQFWRHGPEAGLGSYQRGFRVNPNFVDGRYGMLLAHSGRAKEAIAYMKRVMRVDPLYPLRYDYYLGLAHFLSGSPNKGLPLLKKAARGLKGFPTGYPVLAAAAALAGANGQARNAADLTKRMWPKFSSARFVRFMRFTRKKEAEMLRAGLKRAGLPD